MTDPIEELGERLYRMSPANMADYIRTAQELAGRIHERVKGRVSGRPSLGHADYDVLRRAVLERDNYTCCACLKTRNLSVDHIVGRDQGGPDHENNLWTLCSTCHELKERDILHPVQDQETGRWRMLDRRLGV